MNDLSKHQNQIRFFKLSGSKHSDNVPTSNYKWGTAIVITRDSSSITVVLFPETTGTPVINYWLRISDSWTGWKNFTTTWNSNRVKYYIITTTDAKYKEAFEEWYLNVEEHTACIVHIYAGWEKIIVGFKSDNSYGAFASIAYDESNISMFCKIYDKKFKY